MVIFPIVALLVSAACAAVIGRDAIRRPKPDRIVWTVAFGIFAVAAAAEVTGSIGEWNAPLARVYYLCGAVLVVGYLALGEAYLLAGKRIARIAPGGALLVTALAATLVIDAPIDRSRLAEDGWDAIDRGPALIATAVAINSIGTVVLVGGALYSAWKFRSERQNRHRMIGCVMIAAGTLIVASGGTLTRFGQHEFLYIAMAIGVAVIFAGVLETRRTESTATGLQSGRWWQSGSTDVAKLRLVAMPGSKLAVARSRDEQALHFITAKLLTLTAAELGDQCEIWSVERRPIERFNREQARQAWQFRTLLDPIAQERFDLLPPAEQYQLVELHAEVLSVNVVRAIIS